MKPEPYYRCEATSLEGFVQRLATQLLTHGYYFYVQGVVPEGKDPRALDEKLIRKYEIARTEGARYWRKCQGLANVQYVRLVRRWVLLATHGEHPMKEHEAGNLRDARRTPIHIGGYSITVHRGDYLKRTSLDGPPPRDGRYRVRVLIARKAYRELQAHYLAIACHRTAESLAQNLATIPYEPYAPIRKQLLRLLRLVNARRKEAGYAKVPASCFRMKRQIVRPFGGEKTLVGNLPTSLAGSEAPGDRPSP